MAAIQFNPGGVDADGRTSPTFFDPDTGRAIDFSQVVPGFVPPVTTSQGNQSWPTPQPQVQHVASVTAVPAMVEPKSFDVIKAAKARLRFLKKEIAKLRKLEKEQASLTRLLAAAEKPLAVVRDIKPARTAK